MLYLHPPYHVINGVTLLPDHKNALQYYYQPLAPRLVTRRDEAWDMEVPTLQLIKYVGEAGSGGFLNFDVHLGLSGEELAAVRQEVRRIEGLSEPPRLGPVPLIDGTVRLMMLGKASDHEGEGAAVPSNGGPEFVLNIDHSIRPALFGDNRAAFSVELDNAGVQLMEQAMEGELLPVAVLYSLEYLGLRPAYSVKVSADWELVRSRVHERHRTSFLIVSSEVEELVEEMIEAREIIFDVDTFVTAEEDADVIQRRDRAVKELRDMILNGFFEPVAGPPSDEEDGWDRASHLLESAIELPSRALNLYRYSEKKAKRTDKRVLNAEMRERTTVRRAIYPQGHLNGLFRTLRTEGVEMERFVVPLQLDAPFFRRRVVEVSSTADFEHNEIRSIHARLTYGGQSRDLLLEESSARQQVSWPSITDESGMKMDVEVRYTVFFKEGDGVASRPTSLESPPDTVKTQKYPLAPQDLYSIEKCSLLAQRFPWERYPRVEVELRYEDPAHDLASEKTLFLDAETREREWSFFTYTGSARTIAYRITYRAADHRDVTSPWQTTDGASIAVRDPFPNQRTLEVIPTPALFESVARAFVDLRYEDRRNDVYKEGSLSFSKEQPVPQEFVVALADREHRTIAYRVTLMHQDGRLEEVPESLTGDRRLFLRPDMRGQRFVEVRPAAGFDAAGLREMRVKLRHPAGSEGEGTKVGSFIFSSSDDSGQFEYHYDDTSETIYEYRVMHLLTNGMSRQGEWREASHENLVLPLDRV
jgi:hypothetical protein